MTIRTIEAAPSAAPKPPLTISSSDYARLAALAEVTLDRYPQVAQELMAEIDRATVVSPADLRAGVVRMDSEVEFQDDHSGRVKRVRLVYPGQADIAEARVSVLTPIGAALIGMAKGRTISWTTRTGEQRALTVLDVG